MLLVHNSSFSEDSVSLIHHLENLKASNTMLIEVKKHETHVALSNGE